MKKLTLFLTLLLLAAYALTSCSPAPNAYDFDSVELEPPKLEEGEKAVWVRNGAPLTFMGSVAFFEGIDNLAKRIFPNAVDADYYDNFGFYTADILIYDKNSCVISPDNKNSWNILYTAIFEPENFLEENLSKKCKVNHILCFDNTSNIPGRHYPTEHTVFYSTDIGDFVLLLCGEYEYKSGEEAMFLVPIDVFYDALKEDYEFAKNFENEYIAGGAFYDSYNKHFKDYIIELK